MARIYEKYNPIKSNGVKKSQFVESIQSNEDIQKVIKFLHSKKNKRDFLLFILGISFGLRIKDLLQLQWNDILNEDFSIKDNYITIESKRRRVRDIQINDFAKWGITEYLSLSNSIVEYSSYIFSSQKTNKPLNVPSACMLIKNNFKKAGVDPQYNYCSHTLRKTTGANMYKNGADVWEIANVFGHQSQQQTLCYIGITKQRTKDLYNGLYTDVLGTILKKENLNG
jgi:site-specific recombinase XerD